MITSQFVMQYLHISKEKTSHEGYAGWIWVLGK